jgi:exopolysaccharide production protein ExoF
LVRKGLAVASREFALERIVADLESKSLDIETARLRAIQEAGKADRDSNDLVNDRAARIAVDLREARATLEQLEAKLRTANDLVREAAVAAPLMVLDRSASLSEKPAFVIVRKSDGTSRDISADEGTMVQPGDVVRIESSSSANVSIGRIQDR